MKPFFSFGSFGLVLAAACSEGGVTSPGGSISSSADRTFADGAVRVYDVTVTNLTTGQPFSPGVVVTHDREHPWFTIGGRSSEGLRAIAEDGDPSVGLAELAGAPGVSEVQAVAAPIHRIGGPGPSSLTVRITASGRATRLSLAVMLICTNDGFTGLPSVELPEDFRPRTSFSAGYDAGTEDNDQRSTSIVDPCFAIGPTARPADGNLRPPTTNVIRHHPGIFARGNLVPELHGWRDPVAKITIQRVRQ